MMGRVVRQKVQMCSMGCGFPATERIGLVALCERFCSGRGEFHCQACGKNWTTRIVGGYERQEPTGVFGCHWCGHIEHHQKIRIFQADLLMVVRVPIGPAPYWVREAWLGLPLVRIEGGRESRISAGGREGFTGEGITVDTYAAECVLRKANGKAAAWWETDNKRALHHWRDLVFPPESFIR